MNNLQKGEKGYNVYEGEGEDMYSARITEQVETNKTNTEKDAKG